MSPPPSQPRTPSPHSYSLDYTSSPIKLLLADILTFIYIVPSIPTVILPLTPFNNPPTYDELYPYTGGNLFALFMHTILFLIQSAFLLSLPFTLAFPMWMIAIYVSLVIAVNKLLARALNGKPGMMTSNPAVLRMLGDKTDEKWIFIPGVAVGSHWLQSALDRLSLTFQRPVLGIRNHTQGMIFDIIEVLIERTFSYYTNDVRVGHQELLKLLRSRNTKKVVLILHSQGGIQGGLIVDWLLDQCKSEELQKVEVYTFGCAANHFNNPVIHPHTGRGAIRYVEHYANTDDFVARWGILNAVHPLEAAKRSWWVRLEAQAGRKRGRRAAPLEEPAQLVQEGDAASQEVERAEYQGKIFELPRRGHMMNMHYLAHLFPLERETRSSSPFSFLSSSSSRSETRWRVQTDLPADSLLEMPLRFLSQGLLSIAEAGSTVACEREEFVRVSDAQLPFRPVGLGPSHDTLHRNARHKAESLVVSSMESANAVSGLGLSVDTEDGIVVNGSGSGTRQHEGLRLKDLSRLWCYVNGGSPVASPVETRRQNSW